MVIDKEQGTTNEVWLASFSGKDSWLWSLYKIIRSEDTSVN